MALDLLRFACAMLVLAFHFGAGFALMPPPGGSAMLARMPVDARWVGFANSGWIGVELFFTVSGFVIAWSAEGSSVTGFLGRRALRLLPAAWLCASLTAAVLLWCSTLPGDQIGYQWLATLAFSPTIRSIDPSYWTLGIEVNFYLLMAALLLGGSRLARIERLGVILGCASVAFWLAVSAFPSQAALASDRVTQLTLLPHGCFFALGILLRVAQREGWRPWRVLFALLFVGAGLVEIAAHRREVFADHPAYVPAQLLFALGLLPILFAERLQPWLEARVPASLSLTLGLMTYPLYLLHQELGAVLVGAAMRLGLGYWLAAAVALATVLALAWLTVRHGEPWIRAGLKKLVGGRSARAVALGQIGV